MRKFIANSLLVFVSTAVTVLLGEVLIRFVEPQQLIVRRPDIWQADAVLGHRHVPGANTTVNTGERTVKYLSDEAGYRVGQGGRQRGDDTILLLGDSFMEALQVEYEQSVAGLLESGLSETLGRPVAVRNTGVGAWDPDQYLIQAQRALDEGLRPDLILVSLYAGNDVVAIRREAIPPTNPDDVHPFRLPREVSLRELIDAILYPMNDVLETRSHLFVFLKTRLDTTLMRLGLAAAEFPDIYYKAAQDAPHWSVTADICEEIAALGAAHGVPSLFFLIPAPYQVDDDIRRQFVDGFGIDMSRVDMDQPNRLLRVEFEKRGMELVDTLPALRAAYADGIRPFGTIDRHFSPVGHELVSELLSPLVSDVLAQGARQ